MDRSAPCARTRIFCTITTEQMRLPPCLIWFNILVAERASIRVAEVAGWQARTSLYMTAEELLVHRFVALGASAVVVSHLALS